MWMNSSQAACLWTLGISSRVHGWRWESKDTWSQDWGFGRWKDSAPVDGKTELLFAFFFFFYTFSLFISFSAFLSKNACGILCVLQHLTLFLSLEQLSSWAQTGWGQCFSLPPEDGSGVNFDPGCHQWCASPSRLSCLQWLLAVSMLLLCSCYLILTYLSLYLSLNLFHSLLTIDNVVRKVTVGARRKRRRRGRARLSRRMTARRKSAT